MSEQLYLLGDVSRRLNIAPHKVTYLYVTRRLSEPELRLGNRRIFTDGDINRIATALHIRLDEEKSKGEDQ